MHFNYFNQICVNFRTPNGKGHQRLAIGLHRLFVHYVRSEIFICYQHCGHLYAWRCVNFTRRMLGSRNNRNLWYLDPDDDTLVVPAPSFSRSPQIADVVHHFIPTLWQDCRLDVTASKTPIDFCPY